jgi:cytochrome c oxidase subunit 3
MQIPHEVSARPDTGLYNAKLGIWLFLASEVMLFGGLFSAYIFQRLGSESGYWPHGLLNVPVGMGNTIILIASSVTVVLAWASLKMRRWNAYWWYMGATVLCGLIFLTVKLAYEWPQKFHHFGIFIKKDSVAKYEGYLGNEHMASEGRDPRFEISGHLHGLAIKRNGGPEEYVETDSPSEAYKLATTNGVQVLNYRFHALDPVNADPTNPENDRPRFLPVEQVPYHHAGGEEHGAASEHHANEEPGTRNQEHSSEHSDKPAPKIDGLPAVDGKDVDWASGFFPRHSTYFGTYFLITGLHGLHVLGGVLVFAYMWLFGKELYLRNPEHMANRVEVSGLFWHFVDLVWIFVFPIFYLL